MKKFKNKNTGEVISQYNETHYQDSNSDLIHKRFIVNSCDWEEVIEIKEEYEILSFSYPRQWENKLAILNEKGKYALPSGVSWTLNCLLYQGACVKTGNIKIHSVKRLSDGEIFTVGDKATESLYGTVDIIKELRLTDDKQSIYVSTENNSWGKLIRNIEKVKIEYPLSYDDLVNGEYYVTSYPRQGTYIFKQGYNLWRHNLGKIQTSNHGNFRPYNGFNSFRKATEEEIKLLAPLFRTEDNIDVFPGDTYWCVNTAPHLWSLFEQTARERTQLNKGVKAFSEKAIAEEFLLMNKPLLSLDDLLSVWNGERDDERYSYSPLFKSFKRLARVKNK